MLNKFFLSIVHVEFHITTFSFAKAKAIRTTSIFLFLTNQLFFYTLKKVVAFYRWINFYVNQKKTEKPGLDQMINKKHYQQQEQLVYQDNKNWILMRRKIFSIRNALLLQINYTHSTSEREKGVYIQRRERKIVMITIGDMNWLIISD